MTPECNQNNKVHAIAEINLNQHQTTNTQQHYNFITATIYQISHSNLSQFLIYLKQTILEESLRLVTTSPPHPDLLA